jgi:hypothetical protein
MGLSPQFMRQLRLKVGSHCDTCDTALTPQVMSTMGGFYVGTACKCGPFSRETDYFGTEAEARTALTQEGGG